MKTSLDPKEQKKKHLLMLDKTVSELRRKLWNLPPVKVAEPYQLGWVRSYRLTARARKRRDRDILETILAEIKTSVFCKTRNFRLKRPRRRGVQDPYDRQGLARIRQYRWDKLRWPDSWLKYFLRLPHPEARRTRYEFIRQELFEFEIVPRMITHVRQIDPALESRIAEIEAELEAAGGWRVINHLRGRSYRWSGLRDCLPSELRADESFRQQIKDLRADGVIIQSVIFYVCRWMTDPMINRQLRWMAQTDERRCEAPQRLVRCQLQRPFPFSCVIDVTAACQCCAPGAVRIFRSANLDALTRRTPN